MSKYNSKSIKTVFTAHRDEIFALCVNKTQFPQLMAKVNEILDSKELAGNDSVAEAKAILNGKKNQYNNYLSTLMTYMTGDKVSF